jgi:hypothetical protein
VLRLAPVPLDTPITTDAVSTYTDNVIAGGTESVPAGNIDRRSVGSAYLRGAPTSATVTTGQPMSFFVPALRDRVPFQPGMTGYQALDVGNVCPGGGPVPVGALGNG